MRVEEKRCKSIMPVGMYSYESLTGFLVFVIQKEAAQK